MKLSMYNSIHDIDDHVIKSVVSLYLRTFVMTYNQVKLLQK